MDVVSRYRGLGFKETSSTRAAAEHLRGLADTVVRELES